MSTSHHAEIFLQPRRGVGPYCAELRHSNSGYRDASALLATKDDGPVTLTNEPDALIFQSHDLKKG
jgi:hypothetical protein